MLRKKLGRDLWRQGWQVLPVIAVTILGIAFFSSSYLAYEDLRDSYQAIQRQTHLADYTVEVAQVSADQATQVARLPGVAAAEAQLVIDLPIRIPRGSTAVSAAGRLIGMPLGAQPALNQVVVLQGNYPRSAEEILVERHFADYQHLGPGATIEVLTPGGQRTLTVSGVAVSAEYLWVARSRQDIFPSPAEFGVFFVPQASLTALGQTAARAIAPAEATASLQLAGLRLAATGGLGNRLLVSLTPQANANTVLRQVTDLLGPATILSTTARTNLVGIQLLQLDVDGFRELAVALPCFFLAVGGFIVAALLNRQVDQERPLIGTMLALGTRRRAVLGHYLAYALVIGAIGTAIGSVAGVLLGDALATVYAGELSIPSVTTHIDWGVVAISVLLGLGTLALAGYLPAQRAARLAPAQAMHAFLPADGWHWHRGSAWVGRLPLWLRLPLRDLGRHALRTLATAAGVGAALILIVTTAGLFDAMNHGLALTFDRAQRYQLRADFVVPQSAAGLRQSVQRLPGVRTTETCISVPVQVRTLTGDHTYTTVLQGLPANSQLLTVVSATGQELRPGAGQAILTRSIASTLG